MKTIEVSDEMYDALMGLSSDLNSQNHRCTAMPYMIQVSKKKEIAAYAGCGTEIWVDGDGNTLRTKEDIDEYFKEHNSLATKGEWEIDAYLHQIDDSWREVEVTETDELENFFFTEKGLRKFYGQDVNTYMTGVRNPELETIMTFLCELSGGKLHT